jgi:hypothetical protein
MMIKTRVALVVTLAVCVAPVAVAHPHTHHAQTSHSSATYGSVYPYGRSDEWSQGPGYAAAIPSYIPYRGWRCVIDEGQGRFLPCEMGGG